MLEFQDIKYYTGAESVGINDAVRFDFPPFSGHEHVRSGILNSQYKNLSAPFQNSKDRKACQQRHDDANHFGRHKKNNFNPSQLLCRVALHLQQSVRQSFHVLYYKITSWYQLVDPVHQQYFWSYFENKIFQQP